MFDIFYRIRPTIYSFYRGKNLLWQIIAILLTAFIVHSGFDWRWFLLTRGEGLQAYLFPAALLGFALPLIVPMLIFFWGKVRKSAHAINAAYALVQAEILGYLLSIFYKALTGRMPPHLKDVVGTIDISHGFQFGILKGGIFWGWPSSHTTVAFAGAMALYILFRDKKWAIVFPLYALYIGLAVSTNIHWFSEFAAGAIFGSVVGIAVGKSFLKHLAS